jgi:hypothetical protein
MTADGSEAIVIKSEAGTDETKVNGTTTGDDHDCGTKIVAGTYTNDDAATVTTTEFGNEAITESGTDDGTFEYSTTATDEYTTTWLDSTLETHDNGTATTDSHVDGTVTVLGTATKTVGLAAKTDSYGVS